MEICTWEVYWREVTVGGRHPKGKAGSRTGQKEELGCDTVTTEVSANPVGSAEAGMDYNVISN